MFLFDFSKPRKMHVFKDIFFVVDRRGDGLQEQLETFVIKTCNSKSLIFPVLDNCIKIHCSKRVFIKKSILFKVKWTLPNKVYQAYSKWTMSNLFWDLLSQRLLEETWMAKGHCLSCASVQRLLFVCFLKNTATTSQLFIQSCTKWQWIWKCWAVTINPKPPSIN